MHFRAVHMLVFMALFLTLAPFVEVEAGHGCWKGNSIECNNHCKNNGLNNCSGRCEGFLSQTFISVSQMQKDEKDLTKLTISTGAVRGAKVVTRTNITAFIFRGLPFAEPPIGDLRFRAPIIKKKWEGELNATSYQPACLSTINYLPNGTRMDEDCLYANVYTTENCLREKNCPVTYYIFGGAWIFNAPFTLEDSVLIENYNSKDIVLITMTYRMNSFGFFNTGKRTSAVKNLGLLDMILGLQWTQREIHSFGGDKSRVSIMGHSSGASATDLISLSPKTDGLFHQVIPMSGSASITNLHPDTNIASSRALAVEVGCATEELWNTGDLFENILACLRNKSADELLAAQEKIEENGQGFSGPAIDEPDGVLPEDAGALLRKRRPYRMLIGTTDREFRTSKVILDEDGNINQQLLYATCVMNAKKRSFKHPVAVGRACVDEYSKRPFDIPDLSDDLQIYLPIYESGEAMRRKGATVYKYSFEYDNIGKAFGTGLKAPGQESPYHAEDLVYVMGLSYGTFTKKDEEIQQIYGGMFADFIKTGDPSPPSYGPWQPTDDRNNYFKIDFDDKMNMPGNTNGYHASAVQFWTKTAPEIDEYVSKWDVNGSFSYKKLAQDLIKGLREMGKKVDKQIEEEVDKWKDDLFEWNRKRVDQLEQVLNDLLDRVHEWDDAKNKQQGISQGHRAIVEQQLKETVRQILPSVRNETATIDTKGADWQMWFWVATGACVVLAVILLLTCCSTCYQQSKRRQYERLNESTRLIQTSIKTYG
uniref:Carboxylesterase type B domain-containing protein n=1 Tax=Plectus sambesii TaxID=2011161 RepID=A0A914VCT4_9BILA